MASRIFSLLPPSFRTPDSRSSLPALRARCFAAGCLACGVALMGGALEIRAEEEVDTGSAEYRRSAEKERYFRKAETEFTNRDANGNLVIDEEEWTGLLEEQRANLMSANISAERFALMDADKDGTLSDPEMDAWIKQAFRKRVKVYTDSQIYKQRKAEYEKTH